MRIEKLEMNKIKVTVFPVDLMDMNVSISNLKPDSPQLHNFLFEIMEKVKEETGFNPYAGQIMVEASPVGDCIELVVTKINNNQKEEPKKVTRKVKAVLKNKEIKKEVYFFNTFDDLCEALKELENESLLNAECYEIEKKYALSIKIKSATEENILREFCCSMDNKKLSSVFLSEHAKKIASGESLAKMAEGIKSLG